MGRVVGVVGLFGDVWHSPEDAFSSLQEWRQLRGLAQIYTCKLLLVNRQFALI